jgi:hypothetical protein
MTQFEDVTTWMFSTSIIRAKRQRRMELAGQVAFMWRREMPTGFGGET